MCIALMDCRANTIGFKYNFMTCPHSCMQYGLIKFHPNKYLYQFCSSFTRPTNDYCHNNNSCYQTVVTNYQQIKILSITFTHTGAQINTVTTPPSLERGCSCRSKFANLLSSQTFDESTNDGFDITWIDQSRQLCICQRGWLCMYNNKY